MAGLSWLKVVNLSTRCRRPFYSTLVSPLPYVGVRDRRCLSNTAASHHAPAVFARSFWRYRCDVIRERPHTNRPIVEQNTAAE